MTALYLVHPNELKLLQNQGTILILCNGKIEESNQEGIFLHHQMKCMVACQEEMHPKQLKIDQKQICFQTQI